MGRFAESAVRQVSPPEADECLFLVPASERDALVSEAGQAAVRVLGEEDAVAFAAFLGECSEPDRDEAWVELDHWVVLGVEARGQLVAAASACPWRETSLADIGVLTAPGHRGRGHGRSLVRQLCQEVLVRGREPQYRCRRDNTASQALAVRVGLAQVLADDLSR